MFPVYQSVVSGELQGSTSALQLPDIPCRLVVFTALSDNAGAVYLGGAGVTVPNGSFSEVPSTAHPLGLRGGGEGGTTPALGAVINAICDALAELGVEHVEMPATSERVWRAIRAARRGDV